MEIIPLMEYNGWVHGSVVEKVTQAKIAGTRSHRARRILGVHAPAHGEVVLKRRLAEGTRGCAPWGSG
jgi:hypothetical protein